MKKLLCITIAILMPLSITFISGCAKNEEPLKLGLGAYSYRETATDADGIKNGKGQLSSTFAAVLLDKNGKIVKCAIDCIECPIEYTSEGKFILSDSFRTKRELGYDYNMKAYAGSAKEWFEQADEFERLTIGKTVDEIKTLATSDGKGNPDVITAGCTISVNDFIIAVERAIDNAKDTEALKSNTLRLGISTDAVGTDATDETSGSVELEVSFAAVATDLDGKVSASANDCIQTKFHFDVIGTTSAKTPEEIKSKCHLGADYGMKSEYGSKAEWFEHASAFDTICIGKNATEIAKLANNNGTAGTELEDAGCTVSVSGMIKATVKAATVN